MPKLGLLEDLALYFHYLAHPVEALSRLPGLCRIYLFFYGSSALSTELKESGSSVGGLLTAASA